MPGTFDDPFDIPALDRALAGTPFAGRLQFFPAIHSTNTHAMQQAEELRALTVWKVHTLLGDRKGTWSLSVTGNRRLTFLIDDEPQICDVNLEDYH